MQSLGSGLVTLNKYELGIKKFGFKRNNQKGLSVPAVNVRSFFSNLAAFLASLAI
jgi:hypothetical protein